MEPTEKQTTVRLPARLRRQFVAVESRLWTLETTLGVCFALGGLLVSYLVLFFSDRVWDTPVWWRVVITILGIGAVAWSGYTWSKQWIFHRRDLRALAMIVQKRFRRLGDRLLGIVELTEERQRPANFSPELYRAAIQQVSNEAVQFNFRESISLAPAKVHASIVCALFFVVLLPVLLVPAAGANAFLRWIAPLANIPRYTLVSIEGLPREQIVPHGEAFEIAANVRYRSFWEPARALGQYEGQPKISGGVTGGQVKLRIPGQIKPGILRIRVGDEEQQVRVFPTHRPSLKELSAAITLPEYLRYPVAAANAKNGLLKALEGSQVAFEGKTTRALTAAQIQIQESNPQMLKVQGDQFSSDPLSLEGISQCSFTWQDQLGLAASGSWRLTIEKQKDAAPQVELLNQPREIGILETEVLALKIAARDDFGVRDFGVSWDILSD